MNRDTGNTRFLQGVSILTLSTLIVKVIGLVYKIPMLHYLGAEGMGYFNAAYELYSLFFVVATAGLPLAMSVLVAESLAFGRLRNVKKIFRVSMGLFLVIGVVGALAMSLLAAPLAEALGSPRASLAIATLAPAVFLVSLISAIRGYFQGAGSMTPTALSQVIEAVGKLFPGLLLAMWAVRAGQPAPKVAAMAILGIVVGSAVSLLYLMVTKSRQRQAVKAFTALTDTDSTGGILRRLLTLAIPVTVSSLLSGLTRVVDMTVLLRRLSDLGIGAEEATALFGSYSTLAVPIYHLPSSLIAGIALSLVPGLTDAYAKGEREHEKGLVLTSLRLCLLLAVPAAMGLAVFARPILCLLFAGETEAIATAAPLLAVLGLSVPSVCLATVTGAILQARGRVMAPVISLLAGMGVKLTLAYLLVGTPAVAMMGAPISTLACNVMAVALNFYFIERQLPKTVGVMSVFVRPLCASACAVLPALVVYAVLLPKLATVPAFLAALLTCGLLYVPAALVTRAVTAEDMALLPGGSALKKYMKRI